MQMVQKGEYPGRSSVHFLPMIDMNPNDPNCIYSTVHFVCARAKRYNITPVLTFDQSLWWKAMKIVHQEPANSDIKSVVLRLGGLHVEMSFLAAIGHMMAGSALNEALETIYADNAVSHMLSGNAIARGT